MPALAFKNVHKLYNTCMQPGGGRNRKGSIMKKFWTIAFAFLFIAFIASVAAAQQRRSNPRRMTADGGAQFEPPAGENQGQTSGNGNQRQVPGNDNQGEVHNDEAPGATPDGITPAEETTCDDLKHGTPGLYGLCVAFCEAHDCVPDFELDDPFANCKKNDRKILDKYRQKMRDGDPDMPCIPSVDDDPEVACPCWSQNQAALFPYSLSLPGVVTSVKSCEVDVDYVEEESGGLCYQTVSFINEFSILAGGYAYFNISAVSGDCSNGTYCTGYIGCSGDSCPEGFEASNLWLELTPEEYENCNQQISELSYYCD